MAFFGITALGSPNTFQSNLVSALGIAVFSDEEFEAAFMKMDKDGSVREVEEKKKNFIRNGEFIIMMIVFV